MKCIDIYSSFRFYQQFNLVVFLIFHFLFSSLFRFWCFLAYFEEYLYLWEMPAFVRHPDLYPFICCRLSASRPLPDVSCATIREFVRCFFEATSSVLKVVVRWIFHFWFSTNLSDFSKLCQFSRGHFEVTPPPRSPNGGTQYLPGSTLQGCTPGLFRQRAESMSLPTLLEILSWHEK